MAGFIQRNGASTVKGDFTKLDKLVKALGKHFYTDIGILEGAAYPDGTPVAMVGAVHEFGSADGKIPERSFVRAPLEMGQAKIVQAAKQGLEKDLSEGKVENVFKRIGIAGEALMEKSFETAGGGTWPQLSEPTIIQKGSDEILIDTSVLRKSISSRTGEE